MTFLLMAWKWLISNPWRLASIATAGALAFLLLWTVPHLKSTIQSQKTTIAELNGKIALQNAAVDQWKARAEEAKANQKKAMEVAEKAMVRAKDTVTRIEKEPIPTADKECDASLELLRKYQ